ncbi:MAG: amidohydrolase [Proteobacteria bacterium]|nr:amidohydrolase [Pseudomonadota bacterium]
MLIADAQVHIWAADTPARPWVPGHAHRAHRTTPFSKDDLLKEMDAAGVARVVLVPPSWEGDRNDLVLAAASRHPDRFAIMGRLPIDRPEHAARLAEWRRQPGMLGIRLTFRQGHEARLLTEEAPDWFWPAVERAGIPIMMAATGLLPHVGPLAERHPGVRLAICHLGLVRAKDDAAFADLPILLALAKYPNVAVKASALPRFSSEAYPYPRLHGYIRQVFDAFGPRRVFWGTDMTGIPCSYRQAVTMFTEELRFLSTADQEWVMGRALCEWLGWPLSI